MKFKIGEVVEITVDDNGRYTGYPSDQDLKELVNEETILIYLGRVMEHNKKYVLLQCCKSPEDSFGNNDYHKVLIFGITNVIRYEVVEK